MLSLHWRPTVPDSNAAKSTAVRLGDVYRDTISGFVGTATARTVYLYSTPQIRLVAATGATGEETMRWLEEAQVVPHDESPTGFAR